MTQPTTKATLSLTTANIPFELHPYDYDPEAGQLGIAAAHALNADPACVLKTLMIEVDGTPACVVIPVEKSLDFKRAAHAFSGKSARMMPPERAQTRTGYQVGGISPFGQRTPTRTAFDIHATPWPRVYINAGKRGLLLSLAPADAQRAADAIMATLVKG